MYNPHRLSLIKYNTSIYTSPPRNPNYTGSPHIRCETTKQHYRTRGGGDWRSMGTQWCPQSSKIGEVCPLNNIYSQQKYDHSGLDFLFLAPFPKRGSRGWPPTPIFVVQIFLANTSPNRRCQQIMPPPPDLLQKSWILTCPPPPPHTTLTYLNLLLKSTHSCVFLD